MFSITIDRNKMSWCFGITRAQSPSGTLPKTRFVTKAG